jgi:hypothetical protein
MSELGYEIVHPGDVTITNKPSLDERNISQDFVSEGDE